MDIIQSAYVFLAGVAIGFVLSAWCDASIPSLMSRTQSILMGDTKGRVDVYQLNGKTAIQLHERSFIRDYTIKSNGNVIKISAESSQPARIVVTPM